MDAFSRIEVFSMADNTHEFVVDIRRCACVVKGGRRFSFSALVVVGDGRGRCGVGYGKGPEVPQAVEKAVKQASSKMESFSLVSRGGVVTFPHRSLAKNGASRVILMPASAGTGLIAGGCVSAVLKALGITDALSKSLGSNNPITLVRATVDAIRRMQLHSDVVAMRGGGARRDLGTKDA